MKPKLRVILLLVGLLPLSGLAQDEQPASTQEPSFGEPATEAAAQPAKDREPSIVEPAAEQEARPGGDLELPPVEPATEVAEPAAEDVDPCHEPSDQELLGMDWSRRELFRFLCLSARWFDGFFGEERYDDSAREVRGRLSYSVERRERVGTTENVRFSVRLPLPNLNRRLKVVFERDDERRTIEGRTDVEPGAVAAGPAGQETTQVSVGVQLGKILDQLFDFRLGARVRDGTLDTFARTKYRKEFAETEKTQWRFTQTLFHTRLEGFGETSALDFEAQVSPADVFRWSNNGTWSQSTEGLDWRTGVAIYHTYGKGRASFIEVAASGASDAAVDVANYGIRTAYRQTLGRNWLLGEVFLGRDYPKSLPEVPRDKQYFIGMTIEVLFGARK
jgi:hypothetical protein